MAIRQLSDELIGKIAAGEVVQRPASVVKELIENAIDASATSITVRIENGGLDLIEIEDNGKGIDYEDLPLATRRHATSKIKEEQDLFNITTLGFRGEALASIAAVSEFSIITRTEKKEGYRAVYFNEDMISCKEMPCSFGTIITVKNLFDPVPVRKKFMKTAAIETKHIADIVTRYALINPQIRFRMFADNKELFNAIGSNLKDVICSILGQEVAEQLVEINTERIQGYLGKPAITRKDKEKMFLFVNGRSIKDKLLSDAIIDGYDTLLFSGKYPVVVLNIRVEPHEVDVNIHPQKLEVKFRNETFIFKNIKEDVQKTLREANLVYDVAITREFQNLLTRKEKEIVDAENADKTIQKEQTYEHKQIQKAYSQEEQQVKYKVHHNNSQHNNIQRTGIHEKQKYFLKDKQSELQEKEQIEEEQVRREYSIKEEKREEGKEKIAKGVSAKNSKENNHSTKVHRTPYRLLGQFNKTYLMVEDEQGLMILDQHAAHERVLYERFLHKAEAKHNQQALLKPYTMQVTVNEMLQFESFKDAIESIGFIIEPFGPSTLAVRSVPVVLGRQIDPTSIKEIISEAARLKKTSLDEWKQWVIATMACRAAIKAGDELTEKFMHSVLAEIMELDMKSTCPHGRPTALRMSVNDFEKLFKRKA